MTTNENPVKQLRELADFSVRKLAEDSAMSASVVQAMEYGFYPTLSDYQKEAIKLMCFRGGVDAEEFLRPRFGTGQVGEAYNRWQTEHREEAGPALWPHTAIEASHKSPYSPFRQWRIAVAGVGLKTFCALLCLPPATVSRYESGGSKSTIMPAAIMTALAEAGYGEREQLAYVQAKWLRDRG